MMKKYCLLHPQVGNQRPLIYGAFAEEHARNICTLFFSPSFHYAPDDCCPSRSLNFRNVFKDQSLKDVWVSFGDSGKHYKATFFSQSKGQ